MLRKTALWLIALTLSAGVFSCGPSEEEQMLTQLQQDLGVANAAIDSLTYTVDSSNLLIDELRAQVDSTQNVNVKLLDSVQKLSKEVREWRQLANQYKQNNEKMTAEIERMKVEKQADRQAIAQLRTQADSLGGALLEAHTSIRRQSDQIREMEVELAQTRDEVTELHKARVAVNLLIGTESFLKENGYLDTSRPLGGIFRKNFQLIKKFAAGDPGVRLVNIGEGVVLGGELDALVDRYGKLQKGSDYQSQKEDGQAVVTFTNDLLGGSDVLAVIKE